MIHRNIIASIIAFVMVFFGTSNAAASDFGVFTVSPVFDDVGGRTGVIQRADIYGNVYNVCSVGHYKDGYWLTAAHCFLGNDTTYGQESSFLRYDSVAVWVDGVKVTTKIEEIAYPEGSREYIDGSLKNDFVILKTVDSIALNGFNLADQMVAPTDLQLRGAGSGGGREFPTSTIISGTFEKYLEDRNQVWVSDVDNYGTGICPGDSGGPAYVRTVDGATIYGVWSAVVMQVDDNSCDLNSWRPSAGYTPIATETNLRFIHDSYGNLGSDRSDWGPSVSSNSSGESSFSSSR